MVYVYMKYNDKHTSEYNLKKQQQTRYIHVVKKNNWNHKLYYLLLEMNMSTCVSGLADDNVTLAPNSAASFSFSDLDDDLLAVFVVSDKFNFLSISFANFLLSSLDSFLFFLLDKSEVISSLVDIFCFFLDTIMSVEALKVLFVTYL